MGLSLVPSLGPIGQGTMAAELPRGQGPAGGHLGEVPDPVTLTMPWVPGNFCFKNFVQKCPYGPPEVPLAQARDPGHGAQGPKISMWPSPNMPNTPAEFQSDRPRDHGPRPSGWTWTGPGHLGEVRRWIRPDPPPLNLARSATFVL